MMAHFADLYGVMILLIVFFVIYVTTGDYHRRHLTASRFDNQEEYRVLVTKLGKGRFNEPKLWADERIQRRNSRQSLSVQRLITTTTERSTDQNGTNYEPMFRPPTQTDTYDLYALRKRHVQRVCQTLGTPQMTTFDADKLQPTVLVERKHSILYCGIPKVSSSFWKRTLTVLREGNRFSSPFQVELAQSALPNVKLFKDRLGKSALENMLKNASSFIFVRDPYARLFSGYVNKIYCPNRHYWKEMGTRIAKATRPHPSEMSLKYGHDIKFSEFINYVLKLTERGYYVDPHFAPMSAKCNPCQMPYNFIGKLETFYRDANHLLKTWRHNFNDFNISFSDFEKESTIDTADLHIKLMFEEWNVIQESGYPLYHMALRVWSDLQIRGYVSKTIPFPFHPSESVYITREALLVAIQKALNQPVSKASVRKQREEALIQAYRTISLRDMEKLRKFVLKDCKLFGYDDRPAKLFNRSVPFEPNHQYLAGL